MALLSAPAGRPPLQGPQPERGGLSLKALSYRRQTGVFPAEAEPARWRALWAEELGESVRWLATTTRAPADDFLVCSTVTTPYCDSGRAAWERPLRQAIGRCGARTPEALVTVYECASWGYVLRQVAHKADAGGRRRLWLAIVDLDVHGFSWWAGNPEWGRSGFGVTVAALDVAPGAGRAVLADYRPPATTTLDLGLRARAFAGELRVALPFFTAGPRQLVRRALGRTPALADGYERHGHSFGSDPWIAVLEGLSNGALRPGETLALASLALTGYLTLACATLAEELSWRLC